MRSVHLSKIVVVASLLGAGLWACGNGDGGASGSSGAGGAGSSAGTAAGSGSASGASTGSASTGSASGNAGGTGSGATGTTGTTGAAGTSGTTGSTGAAGTSGATGSTGAAGTSGATHDAGTTGSSGTNGSSGAAGTSGASHDAGGSSGGNDAAASGSSGTSSGDAGACIASKSAGSSASGTGTHKVVVETNSGSGINEGTIFRPADLGGTEKYPIFVWGEGGCSENGLSNSAAMGEIASHGYFVIADGTPNGTASRSDTGSETALAAPLIAYIDWAIAENEKPCSAYYQSLDTTKIAANGFSCGGLMAEGTAGDPRMTTWGINSSGLFSADQAFYKTIHTPVLVVLGGSSDIAYTNGERDYTDISALGIPIMLFSKDLGHGGDLFSAHGGDFTKIDLAWLNWQLKGDVTATGKGVLVGSTCSYCSDSAWEVKSANIN